MNVIQDKIARFGWTLVDEPGRFQTIPKTDLHVDADYQRQSSNARAITLAGAWSWVACGVIIVGRRDGRFWVIDGQHRLLAAMKRPDVLALPCLVFETASVAQEAMGFLRANTARKAVASIDKFLAGVQADDPTACWLDGVFRDLGIAVVRGGGPRTIQCVGECMAIAKHDKIGLRAALMLAAELSHDAPINNVIIRGLHYLHGYLTTRGFCFSDPKFRKRVLSIGMQDLTSACRRASAFYACGGAKIWGEAILAEINKGLRVKIALPG